MVSSALGKPQQPLGSFPEAAPEWLHQPCLARAMYFYRAWAVTRHGLLLGLLVGALLGFFTARLLARDCGQLGQLWECTDGQRWGFNCCNYNLNLVMLCLSKMLQISRK